MKRRVLVVEDDRTIAELERDYLDAEGFEVEIEKSGTKGYERCHRERFDLVILDVMLPGMDGFEICRRLRQEIDIPILLVTARDEDIDNSPGRRVVAQYPIIRTKGDQEFVGSPILTEKECG